MKDFYNWQRGAGRRVILGKNHIGYCKVTFVGYEAGMYQADYLIKGDEVIPG